MNTLSNLSLIITDDCNFSCVYCPQKKENNYMKKSTVEKTVDFFYPYFEDKCHITFFGGEPLLAFDLITYTVKLIKSKNSDGSKKIEFSLTTNGSLLNDEMLEFFNLEKFFIMLSYDGLAQDESRNTGSANQIEEIINKVPQYKDIRFSIFSVFTPHTIGTFSQSLRHIIEIGGKEITFDLAQGIEWDLNSLHIFEIQLNELIKFVNENYSLKSAIPIKNLRAEVRTGEFPFSCSAGQDRLAIGPDESIWGCYLFHDYMKQHRDDDDYLTYRFGSVDDFIHSPNTVYNRVSPNYTLLSQDHFLTHNGLCLFCDEVNKCGICPINAAYSTGFVGKIPVWACQAHQIKKQIPLKLKC